MLQQGKRICLTSEKFKRQGTALRANRKGNRCSTFGIPNALFAKMPLFKACDRNSVGMVKAEIFKGCPHWIYMRF